MTDFERPILIILLTIMMAICAGFCYLIARVKTPKDEE